MFGMPHLEIYEMTEERRGSGGGLSDFWCCMRGALVGEEEEEEKKKISNIWRWITASLPEYSTG